MNLKPLPGYVLVEIHKEDTHKEGTLIVPEGGQEKPSKGEVLDVANTYFDKGKIYEAPAGMGDKLIGRIVVFKRWTESPLKEDGKDYALVPFESLQGVYED